MKNSRILWTVAVIGLVALCISAIYALRSISLHGDGRKVELSQLPLPVKEALDRETKGGQIKETLQFMRGNSVVYRAEYEINGNGQDVLIATDGTVIAHEATDDDD